MFDSDAFVNDLGDRIAKHLIRRASEFKNHRLGAVALETAPWHRGTFLSVLIESNTYRKWDMADWEYQEFASFIDSPLLEQAYDERQDASAKGSREFAPFFRCCAKALCCQAVSTALKLYTLEPDFEVFLADPDDPNQANYCEDFQGVDRSKRKAKTAIVDDLNEALKDALSVRELKYWSHYTFTKRDGEQIRQLKNLEVLNLFSMGITSLPECVSHLRMLRELYLDDNQVRQLIGLESLQNLELLSLRNNSLVTPEMAETIAGVSSLRQLRVGNCGLEQVPRSWQKLTKLEEIYVFDNPLMAVPEWLLELPKLKRLGLVDAVDEEVKTRIKNKHAHIEIW